MLKLRTDGHAELHPSLRRHVAPCGIEPPLQQRVVSILLLNSTLRLAVRMGRIIVVLFRCVIMWRSRCERWGQIHHFTTYPESLTRTSSLSTVYALLFVVVISENFKLLRVHSFGDKMSHHLPNDQISRKRGEVTVCEVALN